MQVPPQDCLISDARRRIWDGAARRSLRRIRLVAGAAIVSSLAVVMEVRGLSLPSPHPAHFSLVTDVPGRNRKATAFDLNRIP